MLSLIDLQIAAVNNTLIKNSYVPYVEAGKTKMVAVSDDPSFNPEQTAKVCVVLDEAKSRDVQSYIRSIENRITTVKDEIADLGEDSANKQNLYYLL